MVAIVSHLWKGPVYCWGAFLARLCSSFPEEIPEKMVENPLLWEFSEPLSLDGIYMLL